MPKKNKQSSTAANLVRGVMGRDDDDDEKSSLSSVSTMGGVAAVEPAMKNLTVRGRLNVIAFTFLLLIVKTTAVRHQQFPLEERPHVHRLIKDPWMEDH
jgi:hypothetical protein